MIELVYGGSGSGKSEFAESEITSLRAEQSSLFYVATMKVSDSEAQKKVERHRKLREGKKFITIETSENLDKSAESIAHYYKNDKKSSGVLLECLSNLVANEMFKDGKIIESEKVVRKIESELEKLFSVADNIVVVSNNIFDDGIDYDKTTREYQKTLAELNSFIAQKADKVSEIVAGIEVKVK